MAGIQNPWLERRVLSYAHQAGAWEAPSSTLFALRRALELGATGIELDVHATSDGRLVVCHDATVDRTTNGSGRISDLTFEQVESLDNAYWFAPGGDEVHGGPESSYPFRGRAPADPEFRVATLDDVLKVMDHYPTVALNLDIKATAPAVKPYEESLARTLHEHGNTERVIVASFLDTATEEFSRHAPDVATSAGTAAVAEFWRDVHQRVEPPALRHVALQVPAEHLGQQIVDSRFVQVAHEKGLAVHVWTVNDLDSMESLLDLGVDGIITDLPTTLVDLLEKRGLSYGP
ncbi:MAG TPA: glycerophosphodiester phosphodiesterase [Acidimicrobiales bacterium]|nr:glycerophosphodiester phosphodiesterase [Acidimicrobiales bacterium]